MKKHDTKNHFLNKLSRKYFIAWLYFTMPIPRDGTLASMECHFIWKVVIGLYLAFNALIQITLIVMSVYYISFYPISQPGYIEPFDELVKYEGTLVRVTKPPRGGGKIHILQGGEVKRLQIVIPEKYYPYLNREIIAYGTTRSYLFNQYFCVHAIAPDGSLIKNYENYTNGSQLGATALYNAFKYMAFYVFVVPWIIYLTMKKLRNKKQH